MFFNQSRVTKFWSGHSEIQFRSFDVKPNTEQLLIRTGINFHSSTTTTWTLGYAHIRNYYYDKSILSGSILNENRIWQQLQWKHQIGRFFIEHRYRFEQRFLKTDQSKSYKNRVRYLLRVSVPLNRKEITSQTFFLSTYNELFIHLDEKPFDRNRLYASLGYQFNKNVNLQLGFMAQTVGNQTKGYLQTALFYNLDFRKAE